MDYLDTKGRIFDIQKYSVHDGPGIRTIVFLKDVFFAAAGAAIRNHRSTGSRT